MPTAAYMYDKRNDGKLVDIAAKISIYLQQPINLSKKVIF